MMRMKCEQSVNELLEQIWLPVLDSACPENGNGKLRAGKAEQIFVCTKDFKKSKQSRSNKLPPST
jgi:hypothetical protein